MSTGGDTRLHTNLSVDAYAFGNRNLGPEEAYRFAKGEDLMTQTGMRVRLRRPLDFLVSADHSGNMGLLSELERGDSGVLLRSRERDWSERFGAAYQVMKGDPATALGFWQVVSYSRFTGGNALTTEVRDSIWRKCAYLVIEISTPKWTAYDVKHFGMKNVPPEVPFVQQERAYTSPIWYTQVATPSPGAQRTPG
jgi:hypothetical protein